MTSDSHGHRELDGNFFVSYRRDDSADVVGRILDRLDESVGDRQIFRDIDDIPLGVDYAAFIDEAIKSASVLLVAIGPSWISVTSSDGERRLDQSNDLVRLEVAAALARGIPIIPLLVRGAEMPTAEDLPDDIRTLALRNGIPIRPDPDFDGDVERLILRLRELMPSQSESAQTTPPASPVPMSHPPTTSPPLRSSIWRRVGLVLVVGVAAVFAVSTFSNSTSPNSTGVDQAGSNTTISDESGGECTVSINHRLVNLKEEPKVFSQDIVSVPVGEYTVEEFTEVETPVGTERWLKIAVESRVGWIRDSTFNIGSKSAQCP